MSEPLLQAVNLECERDERLLFQNLSFSVMPGTVIRIEGPNGTGKTTLLRILAGLNDAWSGELLWCGEPRAWHRESFLRNMLYLGHRPGIKPLLTRSEEHTSELQSRPHLVCRLLLEKKNLFSHFPSVI